MSPLDGLGSRGATFIGEVGRCCDFSWRSIRSALRPPWDRRQIFKQMEIIGVDSLPAVLIMGLFTGMVLAFQSYIGFKRFNAETMVGTVVALSITRELGPVLTGLIIAGRVGAAMAAELGTMRVTEQIDALITMAVNPIRHLVVPRLLASIVMLPLLTIFANIIGIGGSYFITVSIFGANPIVYLQRTTQYLVLGDLYGGLLKATVFGMIIALVSCYKGFTSEGGAEGVGRATTGAVVNSMLLILIVDYFLTALLF